MGRIRHFSLTLVSALVGAAIGSVATTHFSLEKSKATALYLKSAAGFALGKPDLALAQDKIALKKAADKEASPYVTDKMLSSEMDTLRARIETLEAIKRGSNQ